MNVERSANRARNSNRRRPQRLWWACAALVCLASPTLAQYLPFRFDHLGTDQGLSNQVVTCVLRDRAGFLWVGTSEGLNRYDGYEFKHFLAAPNDPTSLSDSAISALLEDRRGNLWVGTKAGGLDLFDRRTETFRSFRGGPDGLGDDRVYRIYEDRDGSLWVGTAGGLDKVAWDGDRPEALRVTSFRYDANDPASLSHNRVTCVARDSAGTLWVGTKKGLNRMVSESPARFDRFYQEPRTATSLPDEEIYCLLTDTSGTLWIGSWGGGVCKLSAEEQTKPEPAFTRFPVKPDAPGGFPFDIVLDATEDRSGNLWFCCGEAGLACLPKEYRDHPDPPFLSFAYDAGNPFGIGYGEAVSACEDAQGILWIANLDGGLDRLDPNKSAFRLYRHHPGSVPSLPDGEATSIVEDADGSVWVTGAGVTHVVPGRNPLAPPDFVHYSAKPEQQDALGSDDSSCLLLDSRQRLWVGTIGTGLHLVRKRGDAISFVRYRKTDDPESLGSDTVLSLAEDSHGTIWVGTYGGLYRMVDASPEQPRAAFVAYRHKDDDPTTLSNNLVEAIAGGPDGSIWAGTNTGLSRLDPVTGAFERYVPDPANPSSLPNESVACLLTSSRGTLWVGTQGGLCSVDPSSRTVRRLDPRADLATVAIASLVEDVRGRLWVGTVKGLYRLDPETGASRHFAKADGLPHDIVLRNSAHRGRSGAVYFGTPSGAVAFDPDAVGENTFVPPVVMTNLLLANRVQSIQPDSVLPAALASLNEITLHYTDNLVTIEFSALNFRQPENNRYAYKLEGLYDDWIETDARNRRATFTNLEPGTYVFRVKAANGDGLWNESGPALRIVVLPPWWKTWWAYAVYIAVALGAIYAGVRYRVRSLQRRSEELEALVDERTAELAESERKALAAQEEAVEASKAKSVFLANMSHELRTPLNAVIGFAQVMDRSPRLGREEKDSLGIIQRSGEHLLGLINDVLSISKIEAGKLTLAEQPFDLARLLQAVQAIIRVRAEAKSLELVFEVDPSLPTIVRGDEGKLRQVLINLLGNAVKFTEHGRVTLRARRGSDGVDRVAFEVEDTGQGISEEELGRLFEAFVQTESGRSSKEGTGLGLVISRQIVQRMGGDITVMSRVGVGTVFRLEVDLVVSSETAAGTESRRVVGLAPGQTPPRILAVDDTDESRLLLVTLLKSTGFDVREAANGAEAVEVWSAWRPNLIFMDMRMPVMDGREATRRIRGLEAAEGDGGWGTGGRSVSASNASIRSVAIETDPSPVPSPPPPTKIVALTASAFEHERDDILACGADDFATKPYRVETIFEKLAEYLGVRYRYDDSSAAAEGARQDEPVVLTTERLAALPTGLVRELHAALAGGDFEVAAEVAGEIRDIDDPLGVALFSEIRAFKLDELLSLLERLDLPA